MSSKQRVSAREVLEDIKSGMTDARLMQKYGLSERGLESLYRKLIERKIIRPSRIDGRGPVAALVLGGESQKTDPSPSLKTVPLSPEPKAAEPPAASGKAAPGADRPKPKAKPDQPSPPPPPPPGIPGMDPEQAKALADDVRQGTHQSELLRRYQMSPSQLKESIADLVAAGYLTASEARQDGPQKDEPARQTIDPNRCPSCKSLVYDGDRRCARCGQYLDIPEDYSGEPLPHEHMEAPETGISEDRYCAWEDQENQGIFGAYLQTASRALLSPTHFFANLPLDAGFVWPILFAVFSMVVSAVFTSLWVQLFHGGAGAAGIFGMLFLIVMTMIISLFVIPIALFVWSGLVHACLMLYGGANTGFQSTFRVLSYSSVTAVFSAIPIVGTIASLWAFYLGTVGLRETHETSTGKAAAAILTPVVVFALLGVIMAFVAAPFTAKRATTNKNMPSFSTSYTGQKLPVEVCEALAEYQASVDSAVSSGDFQQAKTELNTAISELGATLDQFKDHPNIEEVKQKATVYGMTRLSVLAFKQKFGGALGSIDGQMSSKINEFRTALESMCAQ